MPAEAYDCDAAESCTGTSTSFPANQPASSGTTCRAIDESNPLDLAAEQCDGGSYDCSVDDASQAEFDANEV